MQNITRMCSRLPRTTISKRRFSDFLQDSAVTKSSATNLNACVSNKWSVGTALNGGIVMATAINAARECVEHLHPLTFTGYYLGKNNEDVDMDLQVNVLSKTKSMSTVEVNLSQEGSLRTKFVGTFGNLDSKGLSHNKLKGIDLPPIDQCVDGAALLRKLMGKHLKISHREEFRLPPDSPYLHNFLANKVGTEALCEAWICFADGTVPNLHSLAFFSDGLPPCVLNLTPFTWVPTLEYTVNFWTPVEENDRSLFMVHADKHWVRIRFASQYVKGGNLITDGEIWSGDGKTLLASSRQYAKVLTPR